MKKIQLLMILFPIIAFSQKAEKEFSKVELAKREKAQRQSQAFAYQGYQAEKAHKLLDSEMDYRKAISKNKENAVAQYNMGDVLYSQEAYNEATHYYQEASVNKEASKEDKHKAFHNLGNLAMQNKKYEEAVQFYKEALRNNPTDEQTRYNLAIAKNNNKRTKTIKIIKTINKIKITKIIKIIKIKTIRIIRTIKTRITKTIRIIRTIKTRITRTIKIIKTKIIRTIRITKIKEVLKGINKRIITKITEKAIPQRREREKNFLPNR